MNSGLAGNSSGNYYSGSETTNKILKPPGSSVLKGGGTSLLSEKKLGSKSSHPNDLHYESDQNINISF